MVWTGRPFRGWWWMRSMVVFGVAGVPKCYYRYLSSHTCLFRGRIFGRRRCPLVLLVSPRLLRWVNFVTIDNFRKRGLILLDWCCMCKQSGVGRVVIICCCIAPSPKSYGLWCLVCLECSGFCCARCWIF